jgi:hypothetical protein
MARASLGFAIVIVLLSGAAACAGGSAVDAAPFAPADASASADPASPSSANHGHGPDGGGEGAAGDASGSTASDASGGNPGADSGQPATADASNGTGSDASTGPDSGGTGSPDAATHPSDASGPIDSGDGDAGHAPADASSPPPDASSPPPDASTGPVVQCGAQICYAGQSCVNGTCGYATCVGQNVPGDYATLGAAISALSSIGGTICLGASHLAEQVNYNGGPPLTIQGVSPAQTGVDTIIVGNRVQLTVRGLAITHAFLQFASGTVSFTNVLLGSVSGTQNGLEVELESGDLNLTVEGAEIVGSSNNSGLSFSQWGGTSLTASIESSYFHSSAWGLFYSGPGASSSATTTTSITVENNTFSGISNAAFDVTSSGPSPSFANFNNLFVNNQIAIVLDTMTGTTQGNNALFGNTTNYAGAAREGQHYVKSDPLLDTSTAPPSLRTGSPCRGAGDASHASPRDFWGRARTESVDIGATQSF